MDAASLSLIAGSGLDADAVVVSNFGIISAPSSCNGCLQLTISPLGNGITGTGLYSGGPLIPPPANNPPVVLTGDLLQIGVRIDELVRDPEDEDDERGQPDIVVEGQTCT
jgi:hypothetical protein